MLYMPVRWLPPSTSMLQTQGSEVFIRCGFDEENRKTFLKGEKSHIYTLKK